MLQMLAGQTAYCGELQRCRLSVCWRRGLRRSPMPVTQHSSTVQGIGILQGYQAPFAREAQGSTYYPDLYSSSLVQRRYELQPLTDEERNDPERLVESYSKIIDELGKL
jgi:hypothetical protein